MKKMADMITSTIGAIVLISVIAAAADVNINILNPTSGQTFNVGDPVTVNGEVNILSGDTKYGVTIDWGDGTITDCLPLSGDSNPRTYTTAPSNNHAYSSGGAITITANLFHQCEHGADPSKATATDNVDIAIVNTCTLSLGVDPSLNFGNLNPGDTSSDKILTLSNTGTTATISLTLCGTDWDDGSGHNMPAGATHWATSDIPYASMTSLKFCSATDSLSPLGSGSSQDYHFKLQIPGGQFPATYSQTITFTSGC